MNYYKAIGTFDARIDGFDSAKMIGEISKIPEVITLRTEGETVFVTLPFMYRKKLERSAIPAEAWLQSNAKEG